MDSRFRLAVEPLENRDAPVILITVITPLTLFTVSGISFPSYPGPASVTLVRESDVPESDTWSLFGILPGTLAETPDAMAGVYSAIRIFVDPGHRPPER